MSNLPIIGALFKSRSDNRQQTELMVLITPHLVRPLVGGRMLVEDGKVLGEDMVKLATEANVAAEQLAKVNAAARDFVQAFEPVVLDYCVGLAREPYHVQRWCEHSH